MYLTPKEDLLVGGLADWADAGWVAQSVLLTGDWPASVLRDSTLSLIAEVLDEGLMVPGDLDDDGRHVPWVGGPARWMDRISRVWFEEWGDDLPTPGAVVWLANTPAGDEIARAALDREHKHENPAPPAK